MYCSNCGKKNLDTASFCMSCGQALKSHEATARAPQTQKVGAGAYRLIKTLFYIFYAIMLILVPAVVWEASINRVCQPSGYDSSGQFVLGQCTDTTSGLVLWRNAIFAFFITYACLEVMKSIGIYIAHGTKFKDQNTFFMQAMREDHKKKGVK